MAKSVKKIQGEESVHYVPPRKKRARSGGAMQPPMTPMIDVTFQLIIFFLVGFQIRETEGLIPSALPEGDVSTRQEKKTIFKTVYVSIRAQGDQRDQAIYQIEQTLFQTVDPNELTGQLEGQRKAQGSDEVPVVIRAEGDVRWEYVVEAFNAAVRAKLKNVAFASSGST